MLPQTLPFGKHRGQPLPTVPSDYLQWALRKVKLSTGLCAGVAGELARRGEEVPPQPPPPPAPTCKRCPGARTLARWMEDRRGQRRLRAECGRCRRWLGFLPLAQPYLAEADGAASPTDVLDVLLALEDLGIGLESDGASCWFAGDGWHRTPPDLRSLVKQCNHRLAALLGNTARRRQGAAC
jgi:hypothetical protein